MSFFKEFKEFAMRGNVVDMAVGIIIGGAFGKIVSSLVADVIMPPLGLLMGKVDFTQKKFILQNAVDAQSVKEVAMFYGRFVQTIIDFVIVALAIFVVIKVMNTLKRKQEQAPAAPAAPPQQEVLLAEIRDLLKTRN
jgi:large conductance mechanosensitive channel